MSWIAAAAAAAGAAANWMSQQNSNQTNRDIASQNREWSEYMSGTAHQREVEDLKKAGLNPVLSAGGGGATTPSTAAPNIQAPQINMPEIFNAYSQMKQLELAERDMQLKEGTTAVGIAKTASDTELSKAKTVLAQKGLIRAEVEGQGYKFLKKLFDPKSYKPPTMPKSMKDIGPGGINLNSNP